MKKKLTPELTVALIENLKQRFHNNMNRHPGVKWDAVQERLKSNANALWSISEMERTGGEPDIVDYNDKTGEFTFCDCSKESPIGRRSLCYDQEALDTRKENKPAHSAIGMATEMGINLLNEEQYRNLQKLGEFDSKTSSWILTPAPIRKLDGALFCDYRYEHVFTYHNGAQSYYAARGFRGLLLV